MIEIKAYEIYNYFYELLLRNHNAKKILARVHFESFLSEGFLEYYGLGPNIRLSLAYALAKSSQIKAARCTLTAKNIE